MKKKSKVTDEYEDLKEQSVILIGKILTVSKAYHPVVLQYACCAIISATSAAYGHSFKQMSRAVVKTLRSMR